MNNIQIDEELLRKVTTRERQIIAQIAEGLTSGQIARRLGITEKTVEVHRYNILKKTSFKRFTEVVAACIRGGII